MADLGHEETDKGLESLERRIKREYGKAAKEIAKKTRDYMSKFEDEDKKKLALVADGKMTEEDYKKWRLGKMATGKRWTDMQETLAEDWANAGKIAQNMIYDNVKDVYALNRNYAEYQIEHDTKMSTSFTLYNHEAVERLLKDNPKLLPNPGKKTEQAIREGKLKRWSQQKLQSVMTQSILQGDSISHIAERLTQELGEMSANAAVRTARTMTTSAEAAGRLDAYQEAKDMGIGLRQMWVATLDGRTRHEHRILDGQIREVGEPFEVDGEEIMYPGDDNAPGYLVYNCRCTTIAVVEGSDLDLYGLEGVERDNRLGDMSYEEWKGIKEEQQETPEFQVVQGEDISETWTRRADQFDFEIDDIIDAQGFNGTPMIVSQNEFNDAVKASNLLLERVYSADNDETLLVYQQSLYSGKWYVDCSVGGSAYGRGMYCVASYTGDENDSSILKGISRYAGSGRNMVETMTLSPKAKTITYDEIEEMLMDAPKEIVKKFKDDEGNYAAALGYDAITHCGGGKNRGYTVVLNRTALIIKEGALPQSQQEIREAYNYD